MWDYVENFAGSEADVAIMAGFHLDHVLARTRFITSGEERVDPIAFIVASRCMFQLIVVEPGARQAVWLAL